MSSHTLDSAEDATSVPENYVKYRIKQLEDDNRAFYDRTWSSSLRAQPRLLAFSLHHIDSVKSMQENLNALALIATFLAAVQAQVITYSIQDNSTSLQVAINAFFFAGLFLDVIGGCIAFTEAVQLQRIYTLLLRRTTSVSAITNALEQYTLSPVYASASESVAEVPRLSLHIQYLEAMFLQALSGSHAWEETLSNERRSMSSVGHIIRRLDERLHTRVYTPLTEHQRTTDEFDKSRVDVSMAFFASTALPVIVFVGVACLVVGGLCYVKNAQPVGVWVTSFVVVGGILITSMVMMGRSSLMLRLRRMS